MRWFDVLRLVLGMTTDSWAGLDMNLEEFRQERQWSYERLAEFLEIPQARTVQLYAIGAMWPSAERIEHIHMRTERRVTVLAMHKQRLAYIREHGGVRASSELTVHE